MPTTKTSRGGPRAATVQYYAARKCYAKKIGAAAGADGKLRPKTWYFVGCSQEEAIGRALAIKADWRNLRGRGINAWPPDYVPAHKRPGELQGPAAGPPAAGPAPAYRLVEVGALTLLDCAKLYRAALQEKATAGRVAPSRPNAAFRCAARAIGLIGKDTTIASIDRPALVDLVNRVCALDLSPASIRTYLTEAATYFRWIARDAPQVGWRLPERFDDLWEVRALSPKTEADRQQEHARLASGQHSLPVLTVPQLRTLYAAADAPMRAWILLALNCAFQGIDLADLRAYEFDQAIAAPDRTLVRVREKTRRFTAGERPPTAGRWALWPETIAAVRAARAPENQLNRVFLTPRGNPLVSREARSDYVKQRWDQLREAAGLETVGGFKFLRKTSADAIKQLSGSQELAELHLAHKERAPLAENYTNRLWAMLFKAQKKARAHFSPAWSR